MTSWPISVIVSTRSQSEQALSDKLKRRSHDVFEVNDFSKTYELMAQWVVIFLRLDAQAKLSTDRTARNWQDCLQKNNKY